MTCIACGDTGRNSQGGPCRPCLVHGRQPLRNRVLAIIGEVFDECLARGALPTETQLVEGLVFAYRPIIVYAAGFRDAHGNMGMFAGPSPDITEILRTKPPKDAGGRQAYVVRIERRSLHGKDSIAPLWRWCNGRWQEKPRKD